MNRAALAVVLVAAACRGSVATHEIPVATRWSDPQQVVPLDPRVRVGHLANGLTYYIMRVPEAAQRARLWLAVDAGSLEEDDDQRGVAHLVEHMAFRGTTRFPGAAIVDFVEHAGLSFGADLNADTSVEQTVYKLAVPTDVPGLTDRGLDVLHDWASAVQFDPAALELERKIVLEEYRLRHLTPMSRLMTRQRPALAGGWRRGERSPDGIPEVIAHASRDTVTRFYRDWYRPDLMAVIVVGDVDPDAMERAIRTRFADLRGPSAPRARPDPGPPTNAGPAPFPMSVDADPELTTYEVGLVDRPSRSPVHTVGDFRAELARKIYIRAFDQRMVVLARDGTALDGARVDDFGPTGAAELMRIGIAAPGQLAAALHDLAAETERIDAHGFSAEEIAAAAGYVVPLMRRQIRARGVVDGRDEAARLAAHFLDGHLMPSPADELSMLDAVAARIDADDVRRAGRSEGGDRVALVWGPDPSRLLDAFAINDALAVAAEAAKSPWAHRPLRSPPLMATPPGPGSIVATRRVDDLDITEWTLSNGARVVVKPLTSDGQIRIQVDGGGGARTVPPADAASLRLVPRQIAYAGAGELPGAELSAMLRQQHVELGVHVFGERMSIAGSTDPSGLETMLEAVHLDLAAPRHDADVDRRWLAHEHAELARAAITSGGYVELQQDMVAAEADGDLMLAPTSNAMIDAIDPDRGFAIYRDQLGDPAKLTITIVGDVDPTALRPLVERYLASLPAGGPHLPAAHVELHRARGHTRIVRTGGERRSRVLFHGWAQGSPSKDAMRDVTLIGRLLERRLRGRLRQDLGGVYDVTVQFSVDAVGVRWLEVAFTCDPVNAEALIAETQAVIETARRGPVTEDEVAILAARSRRLHEENLRKASWWISNLAAAYEAGVDPHDQIDANKFFGRTTVDNLTAAAAADLVFDGSVVGILNPAAPAK